MGVFPYGWIREPGGDNWQLMWDSDTKDFYAKGTISGKIIDIGKAESWQEARALASKVQDKPEEYLNVDRSVS